MKHLIKAVFVFFAFGSMSSMAQSKILASSLVSGQYEEVKLSTDSNSKSFTGIIEDKEGNISCSLFFTGKMFKDKDGFYSIKAYPFGLMDTTSYPGTMLFREGKNNHSSEVQIKLEESGSCQNIIDLKKGVYFSLEKIVPLSKVQHDKIKKSHCL